MHVPRTITAVACLFLALSSPRFALADDYDPAELAFVRGIEHLEAGRFEKACPLIEESYRLGPLPGTLFTLAECEAKRGRIATAVARYNEYLAMYQSLPREKKAKQGTREADSRAQAAELEPQIPRLLLVLPKEAPAGTMVKRDGIAVAASSLGSALEVDPGEYVLTVQAPGRPLSEIRVSVGRGERKEVVLEVKEAPKPAPPPPPLVKASPDTGSSGRAGVVYAAGGVGLAGLVVGGITGGLAIGRSSVVEVNCVGAACNREGKEAADSMKAFGLVSTIGFVVGLAGVGTAVVLYATDPPGAAETKAANKGRHVSMDVIATGDGGAALGIRGVW